MESEPRLLLSLPVFAFFAAGLAVGGLSGLGVALTDRITIGVMVGLVAGKILGIVGASYLVARFTRASLDRELRWIDVVGVAALAGIGFTVSLLIGELAYGAGSEANEYVKVGVLAGSLAAAAVAAAILATRNRVYRRAHEIEQQDSNDDGIPDVYQQAGETSSRLDTTD